MKLGTMKAVDLHRILTNGAAFASPDITLHPINVVRMEFAGADVLAVATDRFRIGVSHAVRYYGVDTAVSLPLSDMSHAVRYSGEDTAVSLPLSDAVELARMARTTKTAANWRTVTIDIDGNVALFAFSDGRSHAIVVQEGEFVRWRQFFPESGSGRARATTAFTAGYLASFGRVLSGDGAGRITVFSHDDMHGIGQKPMTITIGEHFVGVLLPVKLSEDDPREWRRPVWLEGA